MIRYPDHATGHQLRRPDTFRGHFSVTRFTFDCGGPSEILLEADHLRKDCQFCSGTDDPHCSRIIPCMTVLVERVDSVLILDYSVN